MDTRRPPTDPLVILEDEGLSLLVVRDGTELYRSYDPGVRPLLELVEWFPGGLSGALVVDRVVGGCAARIFDLLHAGKVIGLTGSIQAERILHAAGIEFRFLRQVTGIRNRAGDGICPFEQLSLTFSSPLDLVGAMRQKLAELRTPRQ